LGFSELILDDSFSAKDKEVFAKHLCKNRNDLAKLINDIMDISRIQENQYEVSKKTFNINSLLDIIYLEYRLSDMAVMRNGISFKLIKGSEDTEFEIYSDPLRLVQVFKNLLNNSFYFTSEGFIHFGYEIKDSIIDFFVEDSGCGINESNREFILNHFSRKPISFS